MVDTGSPYRGNYNGKNNNKYYDNGGGGGADDNNVDHFMQDYKEKRKLLIRWSHYFPHENVKEFDVSAIMMCLIFNFQPNDFKHLCIQVFFEAFSLEQFQSYLEWVRNNLT